MLPWIHGNNGGAKTRGSIAVHMDQTFVHTLELYLAQEMVIGNLCIAQLTSQHTLLAIIRIHAMSLVALYSQILHFVSQDLVALSTGNVMVLLDND